MHVVSNGKIIIFIDAKTKHNLEVKTLFLAGNVTIVKEETTTCVSRVQ